MFEIENDRRVKDNAPYHGGLGEATLRPVVGFNKRIVSYAIFKRARLA